MLIGLPSWSRRLKSGARTSLGMVEPSNFEPLASAGAPVRVVAANTAVARASAPTITRAIAMRGFIPPQRSQLGLYESPADRVPHELYAVAHAELREQVGAVRLDRLLRQLQRVGDLAVRVGLG